MQMKQPAWLSMPVLDVRALSKSQLKALAAAYDKLSIQPLDALPNSIMIQAAKLSTRPCPTLLAFQT